MRFYDSNGDFDNHGDKTYKELKMKIGFNLNTLWMSNKLAFDSVKGK